ncbi:MAG TPA: hypothetical protein DCS38_04930 [Ruminococcus sp.]|nr:hypothetical protein [Ruminococcus sp.]
MVAIFTTVFKIAYWFLDKLPGLDFTMPTDIVEGASFILSSVAFFLPINSIALLFSIKLLVVQFRQLVAFFKLIKDFVGMIF